MNFLKREVAESLARENMQTCAELEVQDQQETKGGIRLAPHLLIDVQFGFIIYGTRIVLPMLLWCNGTIYSPTTDNTEFITMFPLPFIEWKCRRRKTLFSGTSRSSVFTAVIQLNRVPDKDEAGLLRVTTLPVSVVDFHFTVCQPWLRLCFPRDAIYYTGILLLIVLVKSTRRPLFIFWTNILKWDVWSLTVR